MNRPECKELRLKLQLVTDPELSSDTRRKNMCPHVMLEACINKTHV